MKRISQHTLFWHWLVSVPISVLGVGFYLFLKGIDDHSSLYVPHFLTLAMTFWWGPQVAFLNFLTSVVLGKIIFPELNFFQSVIFHALCSGAAALAWLLCVRIQKIKINLLENSSLLRFIVYGGIVPAVGLSLLTYLGLRQSGLPLPSFHHYLIQLSISHIFGILIFTIPLLIFITPSLYKKQWLCDEVKIYTHNFNFLNKGFLKQRLQTVTVVIVLTVLSFLFRLDTHWYIFAAIIFFSATRLRIIDILLINVALIAVQFVLPFFKIYPVLTPHFFNGQSLDGEITLITFFLSSMIIATALMNLKDEVEAHKSTEIRLQDASMAKSEFLARMSHEIRTPLNAILGMMDLLKSTPLTSEQSRYIQSFGHAGENLKALINDILDISKIEARQVTIESVPFNLRETVKNVFEMLEQRAESKGLIFNFQIIDSIPENLIGDPTRIRQILLNLLSNALKFTDTGYVQLNIKESTTPQKLPCLLFEVSDSGIGIHPDKHSLLFSSFTQADHTIHRKYGGTGLGLVICKNLVELMGGRIWLESSEGQGTRFFFELPLKIAPIRKLSLTKTTNDEKLILDPNRRYKVMLVDDSEDNLLLLRHYLKNKPVDIIEARNGLEAIEKYSQNAMDFILMDIQMPVMDGRSATQKIRQIEKETERRYVPILALSASALSEEINKSMSVGCNEHLVKPLSRNTLDEALSRYLN